MSLPEINEQDILKICPYIENIYPPKSGGQKRVFPCVISGNKYAFKLMKINTADRNDTDIFITIDPFSETEARARREISILEKCDSHHVVKMGPIEPSCFDHNNSKILYYTEEFIEGKNVHEILEENGPFSFRDLISLGVDISQAIRALWRFEKIHRDIKPRNIMKRSSDSSFVLIDFGIAFDLYDVSLTLQPGILGTLGYHSPEQIDFANRRKKMDFRSDLFSLGIVMYCAITLKHPFMDNTNPAEVFDNVLNKIPPSPSEIRGDIPKEIDKIIMRLLQKKPHLRYRKWEQLDSDFESALQAISGG